MYNIATTLYYRFLPHTNNVNFCLPIISSLGAYSPPSSLRCLSQFDRTHYRASSIRCPPNKARFTSVVLLDTEEVELDVVALFAAMP